MLFHNSGPLYPYTIAKPVPTFPEPLFPVPARATTAVRPETTMSEPGYAKAYFTIPVQRSDFDRKNGYVHRKKRKNFFSSQICGTEEVRQYLVESRRNLYKCRKRTQGITVPEHPPEGENVKKAKSGRYTDRTVAAPFVPHVCRSYRTGRAARPPSGRKPPGRQRVFFRKDRISLQKVIPTVEQHVLSAIRESPPHINNYVTNTRKTGTSTLKTATADKTNAGGLRL